MTTKGLFHDRHHLNHGAVADFASDVGTRAAQLMEIHDDIQQRTSAIADFFEGTPPPIPRSPDADAAWSSGASSRP